MPGSAGYYSVSEAAALLRVSHSTVWRWIKTGKLPAQRVGPKTISITQDDLATILAPVPPCANGRSGHTSILLMIRISSLAAVRWMSVSALSIGQRPA